MLKLFFAQLFELSLNLRNRLTLLRVAPHFGIAIVVDKGPLLFRIVAQVVFGERPVAPFDERPRVLEVTIDGLDRFADAILLYPSQLGSKRFKSELYLADSLAD